MQLRIREEDIMSCPYYKEGYFGVCTASESTHVPNIEKMETYCFSECYRLCPDLAASLFSKRTEFDNGKCLTRCPDTGFCQENL